MTTTQEKAIADHGRLLLAIFPECLETDPIKLCKRLRHHEIAGNKIGLRLCNGPEYPEGEQENATNWLLLKVRNLLFGVGGEHVPIFLNLDPRGYALKIDDAWLRDQCEHNKGTMGDALRKLHKDWGGYGIIAPEIK